LYLVVKITNYLAVNWCLGPALLGAANLVGGQGSVETAGSTLVRARAIRSACLLRGNLTALTLTGHLAHTGSHLGEVQLSRVTRLRMVSLQCRAVAALIGRGKPIGWSQLMYVLDMGELEFAYR